jgi:predicted nucleotidyltransferase
VVERGIGSGPPIDEETIELAARRLADAAGQGARVILFGSHARGGATRYSDLDFLVIEPEVQSRHAEAVRLRRSLRGLLVPVDVIVASNGQVDQWGDVRGTVIHAALSEGRVLHG